MADDTIDDTQVPLDPLISLLHQKYIYTSQYSLPDEKVAAKKSMLEEITRNKMRPYYQMLCDLFAWNFDSALAARMDAENTACLKELDARIQDAEQNLGESDVRDAILAKCNLYAKIGDLTECVAMNKKCFEKTLGVGPKLDLCFQRIRLGLAFSDNDIAASGIEDARKLMKDGDWERRNRFKVYEGLYNVCVRNFEKGANLLLDCLATFASTELLEYHQYIFITVVAAVVTLSRANLKKLIVDSPEVLSAGLTDLNDFVSSIYCCRYRDFFSCLEKICMECRKSVFLSVHVNYIFREVRVIVFNQFLDAYSSVTLQSMASSFNIPVPVLDEMLCTFISNERVGCKIDRLSGNVTTYRGDKTNFQYHKIVKNGDILLNRIQKLQRLVEMYGTSA